MAWRSFLARIPFLGPFRPRQVWSCLGISGGVVTAIAALGFGPNPAPSSPDLPQFQAALAQGEQVVGQGFGGLLAFQERMGAVIPPDPTVGAAPAEPGPVAVAPAVTVIDDALEMRVAIARNAEQVAIGTETPGWTVDLATQTRCEVPAQTALAVVPTATGMQVGDCQFSGAVWLEAIHGGLVSVEGDWYRGRVLLINQGGRLLAVNFVLLRHYLSSVVGSEVFPDWPAAALQAQAIAARSYALTHHVRPASQYFDLDNTQRFQAYRGVAVETNTTQAAVATTAGQFLSYRGGIVESLYAASDQIVQEAHGGQGMSQTGARDLARQGFTYGQILSTYYPGTSISRLVVE